jgi:hypothetical protein
MSLDLTNYIGLQNCNIRYPNADSSGNGSPESGLYINQLPGMSTELADKIASSEEINFKGVWDKVQANAIMRFKDDVINKLFDSVKFNSIIYQTRKLLKSQVNQLIQVDRSPIYTGIYQQVPESKYAEYKLNGVYVYSYQTVSTTFKVWDVNDGVILYTKAIDLVPGLNYISISQTFELKYRILELFMGVDTTNFDSIQTLNDYYYWYTSDWACAAQSTFGYGAVRGVFMFYPSTYDPNLPFQFSNIVRTGLGRGITVDAEIRCSIDQFLSDNREFLKSSFLYLLGSEMLFHKLASPRLNFYTASNLEQTAYTREEFERRYKSQLSRTLDAIPLEGEGICFSCEETFKVATKYPMP